jgi:hypothetical protein
MTANRFRIAGTVLALASYVLLVNGNDTAGISLNIGAQSSLTPFNIQHKCWDMVGMGAFFTAINIHALLT